MLTVTQMVDAFVSLSVVQSEGDRFEPNIKPIFLFILLNNNNKLNHK